MSQLDFVCHAYGTVNGGALTPVRQDGCVLTRLGTGLYRVAYTKNDCPSGQMKATINVSGTRIAMLVPNTDLITEVNTYDAAGVAADPTAIWITIERVSRVQ